MEWRRARWSVCLPLLIFPCTIKSRSSRLAPAQPGGPGKRAVKWLWWCYYYFCLTLFFQVNLGQLAPTIGSLCSTCSGTETPGISVDCRFLRVECPSCYPTTSAKALKEIQSTNPNEWPGLILSPNGRDIAPFTSALRRQQHSFHN